MIPKHRLAAVCRLGRGIGGIDERKAIGELQRGFKTISKPGFYAFAHNDAVDDYYLVRDIDTEPGVFHADEFFDGLTAGSSGTERCTGRSRGAARS